MNILTQKELANLKRLATRYGRLARESIADGYPGNAEHFAQCAAHRANRILNNSVSAGDPDKGAFSLPELES